MTGNSQINYFWRIGMPCLGDAVKLDDNGLDTMCSWIDWSLEYLISLRENSLACSIYILLINQLQLKILIHDNYDQVIFEGVYALHPEIRKSLDLWIAVVRITSHSIWVYLPFYQRVHVFINQS